MFYYYDESTGMEYWHDGEFTMWKRYDGGAAVSEYLPFDDYMDRFDL